MFGQLNAASRRPLTGGSKNDPGAGGLKALVTSGMKRHKRCHPVVTFWTEVDHFCCKGEGHRGVTVTAVSETVGCGVRR